MRTSSVIIIVNFVTSWKRYYSKVILASVLSPTWSSKSQMLPRYDQKLIVEWHIKYIEAGLWCVFIMIIHYYILSIFLFYRVCQIICFKSAVLFLAVLPILLLKCCTVYNPISLKDVNFDTLYILFYEL